MSKIINKLIIILILIIISLIFVSTACFATEIVSAQSTKIKGDLNNSGTIDIGDIMQMLRHIAATSKNTNKEWILSEEKKKIADLNNNNNIDIGDIMIALRYWAAKNNKDISKEHPEWLKMEKIIEPTSIKLNDTYEELIRGSNYKLEATIKPDNADNKTIEWSSSDEKIATVTNGLVTAINAGKAKITAKTSNGKTASCTIVVKPIYVEELTLNKKEIDLVAGKTEKLEASISNSNKVDNASIEWSSSNEKVATVSQTGLVTGIKKGTATITAKAKDGSGKRATCKVTVIQLVTEITFKEKEIVLTPGKTRIITKTISPSNASNKEVEWSSSDSSIASIDTKGKVTAHKKGITTITAKAKDGSNVYATCKVEVTQPVTSIKIEKEISLTTGTTKTLKAEVLPATANNKGITWISSNEKVAIVSQTGVVKGIKKGTATITAKAKDGSGVYAKCKVNVIQLVTKIKLDKTQATMFENDTLKLRAEITPINANNKELKWTSSNTNIAIVDTYGKVTAKKKGTATITATAKDGSKKYATCKITVNERLVTKITLNNTNLTLKVGESKTLTAKIEPENAKNKNLTWKSSNEKVATVTQSGVVTGKKEGTATITVTSTNNKTATCKVEVKKESGSSGGGSSGGGSSGGGSSSSGGGGSSSSSSEYTLKWSKYYITPDIELGNSLEGNLKNGDTGKWKSKDEKVVKIINQKTGRFKAQKKGDTKIVYEIKTKSKTVNLEFEVHVVNASVEEFTDKDDGNKRKLRILINGKNFREDGCILKDYRKKVSVNWFSEPDEAIKFDDRHNGRPAITVNKSGKAWASVTYGKERTIISLSTSSANLYPDSNTTSKGSNSLELFATTLYITPNTTYDIAKNTKYSNDSGKSIRWSSTDKSVVNISNDGVISTTNSNGGVRAAIKAELMDKTKKKILATKRCEIYIAKCKIYSSKNKDGTRTLELKGANHYGEDAINKSYRFEWSISSGFGYTLSNSTKNKATLKIGVIRSGNVNIKALFKGAATTKPGVKIKLKVTNSFTY